MAYKAKDGRLFGNAQRGRAYDEPSSEQKAPDMKEEKDEQKQGAEEVVAEHGKAHQINIKHDHAAGKHHVQSHHESGHVHHSDHATASEAHDHARKLAGADEKSESNENPMQDMGSDNDFSMPGME